MPGRFFSFMQLAVGLSLLLLARGAEAASANALADINPGPDSSLPVFGLTLNGQAFFSAYDGANSALWKSDGTAAGTRVVSTAGPPLTLGDGPVGVQLGNELVYTGLTAIGTAELWKTDGTAAGTSILLDSGMPGGFGGTGSHPGRCGAFVRLGAHAYFGIDWWGASKLYRTNGSTAGTLEVATFRSEVCVLHAWNGAVYFNAGADPGIHALWRSNGEPGNRELVQNVAGVPMQQVAAMMEMGGSLYFFAHAGGQSGLWRLAPGNAVAQLVLERTWSNYPDRSFLVGVLDSLLLFRDTVERPSGITESLLYRTDGTQAGTFELGGIQGRTTVHDGHGEHLNGRFFYAGPRDAGSFNLWVTDGTTAGTRAIQIPSDNQYSTLQQPFFALDGQMYFLVSVAGSDNAGQLWRTDGTGPGTTRMDVPTLSLNARGASYAIVQERVLFVGQTGARGSEPWVYNPGSSSGGGTGGSNDGEGGGGRSGVLEVLLLALLLARVAAVRDPLSHASPAARHRAHSFSEDR